MTGLRVGNASGFYRDRFTAWQEMLDGGELDVLTANVAQHVMTQEKSY